MAHFDCWYDWTSEGESERIEGSSARDAAEDFVSLNAEDDSDEVVFVRDDEGVVRKFIIEVEAYTEFEVMAYELEFEQSEVK